MNKKIEIKTILQNNLVKKNMIIIWQLMGIRVQIVLLKIKALIYIAKKSLNLNNIMIIVSILMKNKF